MNYPEFIEFINNTDLSSKEIYEYLMENYDNDNINDLYKEYISEEKNINFDKVKYYIDYQEELYNIAEEEEEKNRKRKIKKIRRNINQMNIMIRIL